MAARVVALVSLIAAGVCAVGPVAIVCVYVEVLALVAAASVVQLHTGGFAEDPFLLSAYGGAALVAIGLYRAARSRRSSAQLALPALSGDRSPGSTRWPLARLSVGVTGLSAVITTAEWDGNAWLPDTLSSFAVLTSFYLGLVILPWVTLRSAWRLLAWSYRLSCRSNFAAGAITVLSFGMAFQIAESMPEDRESAPEVKRVRQVFAEADGFGASTRALLMATAEQLDRDEYLRRTTPEMRAGITESGSGASLPTPMIAGALGAGGASASTDPGAAECVTEILGPEVRSPAGIDALASELARQNGSISFEDARDLLVDTLIELCLAAERKPFRNLSAAFRTAFQNNLRDLIRTPRWRRCDLVERIPESCTFQDDDVTRLVTELRIADELFCTLAEEEQTIYLLRVVEDLRFREIGERLGIDELRAKDRFHYAQKKLRTAFAKRCRALGWN